MQGKVLCIVPVYQQFTINRDTFYENRNGSRIGPIKNEIFDVF